MTDYFVPENDDITINCLATGYPPPSIQWTRNGMKIHDERFSTTNIPCSSDCLVNARVTSSLMITNASRSDIDMYTCIAMNILGKVNASLQLTVQCKLLYYSLCAEYVAKCIVSCYNSQWHVIATSCDVLIIWDNWIGCPCSKIH